MLYSKPDLGFFPIGKKNLQKNKIGIYRGDLKNEHLNNRNIWIMNFHLYGIQMSGIQMVVWIADKI